MCGISGMFASPDEVVIQRMVSILSHRGPDGNGIWQDSDIALGHTRLSIVDLVGSSQPIIGNNGTVLIANGEIYNHLDYRAKLNYRWQTSGDSEVIIALHDNFIKNGGGDMHTKWIKKLNGMFSFALWDANRKELILARDPLGIKPLVRCNIGGSLLFASEMKAFHAHESYNPKLDELSLALRLSWEYTLDSSTLIEDVHQVRPGTVEVWRLDDEFKPFLYSVSSFERQKLNPTSSWNPNISAKPLLESFTVSVQERLMADVPVGIVLSGGLDSSLVAAVASEAAEREGKPVPECWTVAESEDNPDWIAAENVASSLNLIHHQKIMTEDSFFNDIPQLSWFGEDLDVSVLFFQPLFQEMRKHVKVGLCGQGADEIHGGYPRYKSLKEHKNLVLERLNSIDPSVTSSILKRDLPSDSCWYSSSLHPSDYTKNLDEMLNFELEHGQLSNFQLRLVDRHSMAHSLEVRVPFLGKYHREQSYRLPTEWRLPNMGLEKAALRSAARLTGLSRDITDRPKLPAGTATSPNQLKSFLTEFSHFSKDLSNKYSKFTKVLKNQPDMALGLGLFEALHIIEPAHKRVKFSIESLIEEVLV
ncbi:MAG TPA: asparagine synthase (glutamine-hydrolyzing) [Candidatus Poseidoniaceae archaeon]|nr:MAG TPA: asparagine synthase (glutamine-hydrolyzing) [Candidatus Poseidoniales archaeon]DAC60257.1 MAG TPA: asparagine synthase (glutamine-hydrolyzing) [Candidatus Poseidoniales archaeon]HII23122.1 asparagine synthase (glutamine-hydrolyzing) [Candidatus Poseidoniaceae archaeon]HII50213.1 asparagine synthase (glutamine-hydrolyzing) [Candidatus Poseidoniaceae archaeon]